MEGIFDECPKEIKIKINIQNKRLLKEIKNLQKMDCFII